MGLLQSIFQKEDRKKRSLGVCIPDSSRAKKMQKEEEPIAASRAFQVSGIFHVQDNLMVQGEAVGGSIKKKDKFSFGGTKLVVKDIQVESKTAGSIEADQRGALFLKAEKGKFPIIRIGDALEF